MVDHLDDIIQSQRKFISQWMDERVIAQKNSELEKWALDTIGHVIEEAVELRREFPSRKHWKKANGPLDFTKIRGEYSDLLHFVINLGIVIGLKNSQDFRKVYDEKHEVNKERQATGY